MAGEAGRTSGENEEASAGSDLHLPCNEEEGEPLAAPPESAEESAEEDLAEFDAAFPHSQPQAAAEEAYTRRTFFNTTPRPRRVNKAPERKAQIRAAQRQEEEEPQAAAEEAYTRRTFFNTTPRPRRVKKAPEAQIRAAQRQEVPFSRCMFPTRVTGSGCWQRCGKPATGPTVAGFDACADCPSRFLGVIAAKVCCLKKDLVYGHAALFLLYDKSARGNGQPTAEMLDTGELSARFDSGATIIKRRALCTCPDTDMRIKNTDHFMPLGEFTVDYILNIKEPGMAWQQTDELEMLKEAAAKQVSQQQSLK
jgi:hypothetical protein